MQFLNAEELRVERVLAGVSTFDEERSFWGVELLKGPTDPFWLSRVFFARGTILDDFFR